MSNYFSIASKYLLLLLVTFASCTKRLSEVSIYSNLQEGDSISVALHSKIEQQYHTVNGVSVTFKEAIRNRVDIPLPDSLLKNIDALSVTIHHCSDSVLAVSAIRLNGYVTIRHQDIMNTLWWQDGLMFDVDPESKTIKSRINSGISGTFPVGIGVFYNPSHPVGLQLILRLSLCAALLLLVVFLYRQSSSQRILLVSVAFFVACFPLKMEWSNWTLGIMGLVALVTFITDRERRFRWRPIYWLPVAIYALYLAGCLYAGHKADAYRELDASISLIIFPIVFSIVCLAKDNIFLLLRFFIRAAMAFCAFGLLSFAAIVPEFGLNMLLDGKLYSPLLLMWPAFAHPSAAAMVLAMAVPVAMYLHRVKGISMVEMLLCLCCVMIFSMLAGARVATIAVPMVIVLGVGVYCKIKPVFKWVLAGIAVAGCVFIFNKYPELTNRFSDPIREQLRTTAIDAFRQKPVFGWGTGSMKQIIASEETAQRLGYDAPQATLNHFHNQYLDSLVQFGIAGSLVFFALFVSLACIAVRRKNFLLAAFLAIYLLFMLVESPLATVKGIQPMMFWLCFFTGSQNITAERYPHKNTRFLGL